MTETVIQIKLSEIEKNQALKICEKLGISLSSYIKKILQEKNSHFHHRNSRLFQTIIFSTRKEISPAKSSCRCQLPDPVSFHG